MSDSVSDFVRAALERQAVAEEKAEAAELDLQERLARVLKFGKKLNSVARSLMYAAIDAGFDAGESFRHDYWFKVRHSQDFNPGPVLQVGCLGHWAAIGLGEDWRWSFGRTDMGPDGESQTLENIKANLEAFIKFALGQHLHPDPKGYRPGFQPTPPTMKGAKK